MATICHLGIGTVTAENLEEAHGSRGDQGQVPGER